MVGYLLPTPATARYSPRTQGLEYPFHSRLEKLHASERGYAMAALLVAMSVMAIMMSAALPAWQTLARREKEAELIFRGQQYARAIGFYQQKFAGAYPASVDLLITERFLRKKYKDPITNDDFELVRPGAVLPAAATSQGQRGSTASGVQARTGGAGTSISTTTSLTTTGAARGGASQSTAQTVRITSSVIGSVGPTTGIMGVRSKSIEKSFRLYNGSDTYKDWVFIATQAANRAGSPTGGRAGGVTGRGQAPGAGVGRGGAATTPQSAPGRGGVAAPQGGAGRGRGF